MSQKEIKVLIFQRELASYRIPLFAALSKQFSTMICASCKMSSLPYLFPLMKIAQWRWGTQSETAVIQQIFTPIFYWKPSVVIAEFSVGILSNYVLYLIRPLCGFKLVLWGHGYNYTRGFKPGASLLDSFRVFLMNAADAVLVYTHDAAECIKPYLKNPGKVLVAHNTIDTDSAHAILMECRDEGKESIKVRWGIREKKVICFLGRLVEKRELEVLFDVCKQLQKTMAEPIGLVIIGDGPERRKYEDYVAHQGLQTVYFVGAQYERAVGELLFISDIMVYPGPIGLALVHAFCYGVPVIVRKGAGGPYHSPEIIYLKNGYNGCAVSATGSALYEKTRELLTNEELLEKLRKGALETVQTVCAFSQMIRQFTALVAMVGKTRTKEE